MHILITMKDIWNMCYLYNYILGAEYTEQRALVDSWRVRCNIFIYRMTCEL